MYEKQVIVKQVMSLANLVNNWSAVILMYCVTTSAATPCPQIIMMIRPFKVKLLLKKFGLIIMIDTRAQQPINGLIDAAMLWFLIIILLVSQLSTTMLYKVTGVYLL